LLADRWGRDLVILALGGGVVTDLAGFVAATYLRGVPWVALPTTLLGMVDAAIGGKTGVNTPAGKNLVGAFHRPLAVVADLRTLTTLPDEVLRAGLAEMVKHAALADRGLLDALAGSAPAFASRDLAIIEPLVARAAAIKAAVVARDEHEAGLRQVLNFGHTVGHALEAASGLALPHGQAVAIGMVVEARAACRAGRFPPGDLARLVDVLERLGLPTRAPGPLRLEALRSAFAVDKKNRGGEVRFSIPRALGDVGDGADGHAGSLDLDEVLRALGDPA
jgi:3-dehydroquinate synthase